MSVNEFERLLDRYYRGSCTEAECVWVERWLANAKLDTDTGWDRLTATEKQAFIDRLYSAITRTVAEPQAAALPSIFRRRRRLWWAGGIAASICFAVVAYLSVRRPDTAMPIEWQTVVTEPGQRKQLQLTDGTTVWLQGGGELTYPTRFAGNQRVVRLDGEAYFDVSHNAERPFIVSAGELETEVLGTAFNVEAFSELDKKVVSLLTGRVAVRIRDSVGAAYGDAVVLAPNEAAVFDRTKVLLAKNDLPVFGSAEDFKSGNLKFDETSLDDVLFRLGKAYGITIEFDREKAAQHRITGDFAVGEPIDDVFRSLARSTGAQYRRNGKTIRLDFK